MRTARGHLLVGRGRRQAVEGDAAAAGRAAVRVRLVRGRPDAEGVQVRQAALGALRQRLHVA
jgi:hypothetical protein